MMNMKTILKIALGTTVWLTACNVDNAIRDTSPHGKLSLSPDWSRRGDGVAIPTSYRVRLDNGKTNSFSEQTGEYAEQVDPGDHRIYAYNEVNGISVTGSIITMNPSVRSMDSHALTGPDWFFSCAVGVNVEAGREYVVKAPMEQQLREVTVIFDPADVGSFGTVDDLQGSLTGMAGTLNMDNGVYGNSFDMPLRFTKITSGVNAGKWTATARVLGVAGGGQHLTGEISFEGNVPAIDFDFDLASNFSNFNRMKTVPLTINLDEESNGPIQIGVKPYREMTFNITPVQTISGVSTGGPWVEGDRVGIFAVNQGGDFAPGRPRYLNNMCLIYTDGQWVPEGAAYWPEENITLDFYAYYPYDATLVDPTAPVLFSVQKDQSTDGAFHQSDLLVARGSFDRGNTVSFSFGHALAMVELTIEDINKRIDLEKPLSITLQGMQTSYPVTNPGVTEDVVMHREADAQGIVFRALMPPQTLGSSGAVCHVFSDGAPLFDATLVEGAVFASGSISRLTIKYI